MVIGICGLTLAAGIALFFLWGRSADSKVGTVVDDDGTEDKHFTKGKTAGESVALQEEQNQLIQDGKHDSTRNVDASANINVKPGTGGEDATDGSNKSSVDNQGTKPQPKEEDPEPVEKDDGKKNDDDEMY